VEDADEPVREGAQGLVMGRLPDSSNSAAAPGSTTFCGVHTWQVKVDLLATFATPRTAGMSDQTTGGGLSDYDLVGGGPAVSAIVTIFMSGFCAIPSLPNTSKTSTFPDSSAIRCC
jgi:hypothetical protein